METIRLDELTARQFNTDLATAAALIMEGRVWIGAVPADKAGTAVPVDTTLTLREKPRKFASRSGYKLEKALSAFSVDPAGAPSATSAPATAVSPTACCKTVPPTYSLWMWHTASWIGSCAAIPG